MASPAVSPTARGPRRLDGGRTTGNASADLARYYDLDMQDEDADLDLYLALARRTGGSILELAVGSGRVALPLANAGHRVVGVDIDSSMLGRARAAWRAQPRTERAGALDLHRADITRLRLDERFDLVILAQSSLLLLPGRVARLAALATMAAHLAPSGLAVVDIVLPGPDELAACDGRLQLEWMRKDPDRDETVAKMTSARYDPVAARLHLTQLFDAHPTDGGPLRRVSRTDALWLVGAEQLLAELADAGLREEQVGGDHLLTPLGTGSARVVVLARRV